MCKLIEIFHVHKGYQLAVAVAFIPTWQNRNLWYIFPTIFARKLSSILHETNDTVLVLEVRFSQRIRF